MVRPFFRYSLYVSLGFVLLKACVVCAQDRQPYTFFTKNIKLSEDDVQTIERGGVFAKILEVGGKPDVFIFGATFVNGPMQAFLQNYRDIKNLKQSDDYLAVGRFSKPPRMSDLAGFTLEPPDIQGLQKCKPGDCELQLTEPNIEAFRSKINWSSPQAGEQAQQLMRQQTLPLLQNYQRQGNSALGVYRDKSDPSNVAEQLSSLLEYSDFLPAYLPEFHRYFLNYPKAKLKGAEEFFYWEKVKFGLKPTLRVNHVVIYKPANHKTTSYVTCSKQLYSSHYFEAAVDFWFLTRDSASPNRPGFYLITLKGSRQYGLTGFKGTILRNVATREAQSSMEKALAGMKQKIEAQPARK